MFASHRQKQLLVLQLSGFRQKWHRIMITSQQASSSSNSEAYQDVTTSAKQISSEMQQLPFGFAHAKLGSFFQARPILQNQYTQDTFLISFLRRHIPREHFLAINADLERFGDRVVKEIYDLSLQMESDQPRLEQIDAWGQRVDKLITSPAWSKMKEIAAEEGLISCGYERKYAEWSRLYQIAKFYLFEPSGGLYGCPLAMTDGAAKTLELEQIDAWGQRVDKLITSPAWSKMKEIAAEEGLISCGYERKYAEWSRLYQIAKFYLFEPSGGLYGCPLAMTDGAAKTLELLHSQFPSLYEKAFNRITSRDPKVFWTSGQWMTEKQGGSDVAKGTETVAVEQPDGSYKLYGYKWFSSATDADIALTLARIVGKDGSVVEGTRGLTLFYLEVRDEKGAMNNIQMLKLKNKLGTKQLPTAELLIDGARAYRISDESRGVASMASMLTLTRIHTAMGAASAMRRIVNLARDYATRRAAFGKTLHRHPLHVHTLAEMEVETRAASIFVFEIARLLGRQEVLSTDKKLEAEGEVLRLLVPLAKLYISKKAVAVVSEGLECFGGQGYIEDTDLPRILRDTQVNAIWEGTTNILSLDVLRAVNKSAGSVLVHYSSDVLARISIAKELPDLQEASFRVEKALKNVLQFAIKLPEQCVEMAGRVFAFSLARIYIGALLIEHASQNGATQTDVYTAERWCERDLSPLCTHGVNKNFTEGAQKQNLELVFDGYPEKSRL